jgi:hypothetical protein
MSKGSFRTDTIQRMALYKREVLHIQEDGVYRKNKQTYPHILPLAQRRLNILSVFRDRFWDWFAHQGIRLHSDFHHLNSSQALCFNLFFPFLLPEGRGLTPVIRALGLNGSPVASACFEFEPDSAEGTNFDFMIPLDTSCRIYFEVKYTEAEFGKAKPDEEHLRKFRSVYSPRLEGRFESPFCTEGGFLRNYQILRNLWHLDLTSSDSAVFLFPRANQSLTREETTVRSCLLEPLRPRVKIVYLEDFVSALACVSEVRAEENALSEFRLKYLAP